VDGRARDGRGLTGGLLIKGVFVVLILLAIAVWFVINPQRSDVPRVRSVLAVLAGLVAMVAVAARVRRALSVSARVNVLGTLLAAATRTAVDPYAARGASTLAMHVLFYISRVHLASGAMEHRACRHPVAIPLPPHDRNYLPRATRASGVPHSP
jgi:hypothetical protein